VLVLVPHFLFGAQPATWIPFRKQASSRTFGRHVFLTTKLATAEESQPAKRHKPTNSPTLTQFEESEPIGVQISTQLVIHIGEEAKVDTAPSLSWTQTPGKQLTTT
jgi:hypothetical protein